MYVYIFMFQVLLHYMLLQEKVLALHSRALVVYYFIYSSKWQPTPVFLPGESQGRGSLVGCRLWGPMESDTAEAAQQQQQQQQQQDVYFSPKLLTYSSLPSPLVTIVCLLCL